MKRNYARNPKFKTNQVVFVVSVISAIMSVGISIWCLSSGYFIIFQNLFYLPIIISCVYYTKRGFVFSAITAFVYFVLVVIFTRDPSIHIQALIRVVIFILIAAVITYISLMQKQAEARVIERTKELADANERLKELDQLKSLFIASMSHELRTPLNSIIGFTGILLQGMAGPLNDEQIKQLGMVKKSSVHLLALINDVIDVSKIEAGKIELVIGKFDLSRLAAEVCASFKDAASNKQLALNIENPGEIIITSDERRVKQIIMNLVSNAIKYTNKGTVKIALAQTDAEITVKISDSGIGIKTQDMPRLFKQFSRISVEGEEFREGTGLGLYLSQKLARVLGGEITAASTFGQGSEFTLTLPIEYKGERKT